MVLHRPRETLRFSNNKEFLYPWLTTVFFLIEEAEVSGDGFVTGRAPGGIGGRRGSNLSAGGSGGAAFWGLALTSELSHRCVL